MGNSWDKSKADPVKDIENLIKLARQNNINPCSQEPYVVGPETYERIKKIIHGRINSDK